MPSLHRQAAMCLFTARSVISTVANNVALVEMPGSAVPAASHGCQLHRTQRVRVLPRPRRAQPHGHHACPMAGKSEPPEKKHETKDLENGGPKKAAQVKSKRAPNPKGRPRDTKARADEPHKRRLTNPAALVPYSLQQPGSDTESAMLLGRAVPLA